MVHLRYQRSLRRWPEVEDYRPAEIHDRQRSLTGPRGGIAGLALGTCARGYTWVLAKMGDGWRTHTCTKTGGSLVPMAACAGGNTGIYAKGRRTITRSSYDATGGGGAADTIESGNAADAMDACARRSSLELLRLYLCSLRRRIMEHKVKW